MHNLMDEHDYKKMIRFMKKSYQSFCKEVVEITKPFIDNIDFLLVNFPYFKEIEMVSKYFMTQNEDFNHVFIAKFYSFSNIIFYNPELICEMDNYDSISVNKLKLWDGVLGRSGRKKLRRSWVRCKGLETDDTEIYTLNDKEVVLRLFFDIINYHFKKMKKVVLDHINIKKVLEYLYIDDSLMDRILNIEHTSIFKGIDNVSEMFIKSEKYNLLEKYYENEHDVVNDNLDTDRLTYLFLINPHFLEYKTIYNVLKLKARHIPVYENFILKRGDYYSDKEMICSDTKYYLYLSLLNINPPEVFFTFPSVTEKMINLWFLDAENAFILFNNFKFIDKDILHSKIFERIQNAYRNGLSESVKSKPKVNTIFSFCRKLLKKDKLSFISYHETDKINEYIDECFDDSFMRYICKLVIDEVPVLNIFEKQSKE